MTFGKRMKTAMALVVVSALLTVTACTGNSPSTTNNGGTSSGSNTNQGTLEPKDPFGPLPERMTLTIFKDVNNELLLPEGESATDNRYIKAMEEQFNIAYEFPIAINSGPAALDKKKLMVASNDITDAMVVEYDLFLQMVKSDMLADLTDAFEQYASPAVKSALASDGGKAMGLATIDGKLYGIPSMATVHDQNPLVWIRKDWLEAVNMEPPANLDELIAIAKAFKEQDPNRSGKDDTIGFPGYENFANASSQPFSYDIVFDIYKAYAKTWLKQPDGTYTYSMITPEAKEAVGKLREMYAAGLIPRDFPIQKQENAAEAVASGKAGIFFGPWWAGWWPLSDQVKNDPSADWGAYALPDVDGNYKAKQMTPIASIAVLKKGYKYPEALVKTINAFYAFQVDDPAPMGGDPYQGLPLPSWTSLPIAIPLWRADAVIMDHHAIMAELNGEPLPADAGATMIQLYKDTAANWSKGMDFLKANPDLFGEPVSRIIGVQPIVDNEIEPVYGDFFGTTRSMERRKANLDKLETDAMLKIITGEQPLDYFDTYREQWLSMGGQDILNEIKELME